MTESHPWDALDDFAGPGGWDLGALLIGVVTIGAEWDKSACETAIAAGFARRQVDISTDSCDWCLGVRGYIASPPCTLFSNAGSGLGRLVLDVLTAGIERLFAGDDAEVVMSETRAAILPVTLAAAKAKADDDTTEEQIDRKAQADAFVAALVLEPARRIMALRPEWIALEQVPAVLPLWRVYARNLRAMGYSAWTTVLCAADYGVPQERYRAVLGASRVRTTEPPPPTHAEHPQGADLFGAELAPWVSMAEALGWGFDGEPSATVTAGHGGGTFASKSYRQRLTDHILRTGLNSGRDREGNLIPANDRDLDRPAPTVTSKSPTGWVVEHRSGDSYAKTREGAEPMLRPTDRPAPTLTSKTPGAWVIRRRPEVNNQSGGDYDLDEQASHPATVVATREIVGFRGANANRFNGSSKSRNDGFKITVAEAGVLQSFPWDYPWQGTKGKQLEQVGNAVPPLMAAHVLAAVTGAPVPTWEAISA